MAFGPTRRADTPKNLMFGIELGSVHGCHRGHGALRGGRVRFAEHEVEVEVVDALTSADRFALIVVERFHRGGEIVEIRRANVCGCFDGRVRSAARTRPGRPGASGSPATGRGAGCARCYPPPSAHRAPCPDSVVRMASFELDNIASSGAAQPDSPWIRYSIDCGPGAAGLRARQPASGRRPRRDRDPLPHPRPAEHDGRRADLPGGVRAAAHERHPGTHDLTGAHGPRPSRSHHLGPRSRRRSSAIDGSVRCQRRPSMTIQRSSSSTEPEIGFEPTTYRLQGGCSTS